MSILKIATLIGVACLTAFIGYRYVTADPPGYCRAQDRYISDEELLKAAVALFEWDMNRETRVYPEEAIKKRKNYSTSYQYWKRTRYRPDCCEVDRINTRKVFRRMFGTQEVKVVLYTGESRGDSQAWFNFDVCGTLIPSDSSFLGSGVRGVTTSNYFKFINSK